MSWLRTPTTTSSPLSASSSSEMDTSPELKQSSSSASSPDNEVPLSRTYQYKKITKPLLERKRRARINKCLDELKDIMTVALQAEGENVSKLEKADILELTVRHLHKLNHGRRLFPTGRHPLDDLQKFHAGYASCAQEAAGFLLSTPGVDVRLGQRMLAHLSASAGPAMAANMGLAGARLPPPPPHHQHPLQAAGLLTAAVTAPPPPLPQLGGACSPPLSRLAPPLLIPTSTAAYPRLPVTAAATAPSTAAHTVGSAVSPTPSEEHSDAKSPSPLTLTQGSFTLSISRQSTPEPLTERNRNEKSLPVRPAAIRLNPGQAEPVWRPYTNN